MPKESCGGLLLHRRTIGILGMGRREVARIFIGEADVVAYDPFVPLDAWADIAHKRVTSLEEVLKSADVITVHMPLTDETRGLISYERMRQMRRMAVLINTARGGIVDEADLERALSGGLIWGAGLDCHEEEPPSREVWAVVRAGSCEHAAYRGCHGGDADADGDEGGGEDIGVCGGGEAGV